MQHWRNRAGSVLLALICLLAVNRVTARATLITTPDSILEGAIAYYREALDIGLRLGDRATAAIMMANLSGSYLEQGSLDQARAMAEGSVETSLAGGDRRAISLALLARAEVALADDESARARDLARESLDYRIHEEDWHSGVRGAIVLLHLERRAGRTTAAAETLGLIRARQDLTEVRYYPGRQAALACAESELRAALGEAPMGAASRRGALLTMTDLGMRLSQVPV